MGIFRRFWSGGEGRNGNAAILFALALVPLVGATGAAVDYSMANSNRTSMQKALDATALALAKLMPLSQAQLDTQGWQIFQASLGNVSVTLKQSDLKIQTPATGKLILDVSGQYQPSISGVIGIQNFPVGAHAEVTWGIKKLEVALALDNTGSMASNNKMTELKKAAKNLIDTLQKAAKNPGDVKVSIIPFHIQTKVGTSNVNATWLRWDIWESENGSCNKSGGYNTQSSCTSQKVCTKSQYNNRTDCQDHSGSWVTATWTPANHNTWTGCVEDRDQDHDALDTAPTTTATKFPAIQCSYSLTEIMPLNYVWDDLKTRIDSMQPNGNTNVTIGLAWAWHSLTQGDPLTQAAAPAPDLSKYIILLTDGDNTQNRWTSSQNSIDTRTALACTNAKAAGFRIYTIRVINGNATLLRNCATDPSMYFDVDSASELDAVFNAIGGQLASLHLSQ
ncbi:MAG: VWA domain-containing protein [Acidobacteria bacterium]|nr:VWA domain-containing protein [Acidobacteriota bacterium]MBX3534318.1 VWA domain-containing protein [Xanthobacteraceae bacterium]MBX3550123.1 VWA domain-containing protein [Xanthobacteraceae bacterium]MCW5676090.1 VWA domain-containing protein [Xanthobacteraceae bacterium]MCW5677469.1 VWA domain-containing protein [Xanthobacteraceae bacterium]